MNKTETFRCAICGNSLSSQRNLTRHMKILHGTVKLSCSLCNITVANNESYVNHLKFHNVNQHLENNESFQLNASQPNNKVNLHDEYHAETLNQVFQNVNPNVTVVESEEEKQFEAICKKFDLQCGDQHKSVIVVPQPNLEIGQHTLFLVSGDQELDPEFHEAIPHDVSENSELQTSYFVLPQDEPCNNENNYVLEECTNELNPGTSSNTIELHYEGVEQFQLTTENEGQFFDTNQINQALKELLDSFPSANVSKTVDSAVNVTTNILGISDVNLTDSENVNATAAIENLLNNSKSVPLECQKTNVTSVSMVQNFPSVKAIASPVDKKKSLKSCGIEPPHVSMNLSICDPLNATTFVRVERKNINQCKLTKIFSDKNVNPIMEIKCHLCNLPFKSDQELIFHGKNVHRGAISFSYSCHVCKNSYKALKTLYSHMRIHASQMPFKCISCNKGFSQISSLLIHQLSHEENKNFLCEYCGTKFSRPHNLTKHRLNIHSVKETCQLSDLFSKVEWKDYAKKVKERNGSRYLEQVVVKDSKDLTNESVFTKVKMAGSNLQVNYFKSLQDETVGKEETRNEWSDDGYSIPVESDEVSISSESDSWLNADNPCQSIDAICFDDNDDDEAEDFDMENELSNCSEVDNYESSGLGNTNEQKSSGLENTDEPKLTAIDSEIGKNCSVEISRWFEPHELEDMAKLDREEEELAQLDRDLKEHREDLGNSSSGKEEEDSLIDTDNLIESSDSLELSDSEEDYEVLSKVSPKGSKIKNNTKSLKVQNPQPKDSVKTPIKCKVTIHKTMRNPNKLMQTLKAPAKNILDSSKLNIKCLEVQNLEPKDPVKTPIKRKVPFCKTVRSPNKLIKTLEAPTIKYLDSSKKYIKNFEPQPENPVKIPMKRKVDFHKTKRSSNKLMETLEASAKKILDNSKVGSSSIPKTAVRRNRIRPGVKVDPYETSNIEGDSHCLIYLLQQSARKIFKEDIIEPLNEQSNKHNQIEGPVAEDLEKDLDDDFEEDSDDNFEGDLDDDFEGDLGEEHSVNLDNEDEKPSKTGIANKQKVFLKELTYNKVETSKTTLEDSIKCMDNLSSDHIYNNMICIKIGDTVRSNAQKKPFTRKSNAQKKHLTRKSNTQKKHLTRKSNPQIKPLTRKSNAQKKPLARKSNAQNKPLVRKSNARNKTIYFKSKTEVNNDFIQGKTNSPVGSLSCNNPSSSTLYIASNNSDPSKLSTNMCIKPNGQKEIKSDNFNTTRSVSPSSITSKQAAMKGFPSASTLKHTNPISGLFLQKNLPSVIHDSERDYAPSNEANKLSIFSVSNCDLENRMLEKSGESGKTLQLDDLHVPELHLHEQNNLKLTSKSQFQNLNDNISENLDGHFQMLESQQEFKININNQSIVSSKELNESVPVDIDTPMTIEMNSNVFSHSHTVKSKKIVTVVKLATSSSKRNSLSSSNSLLLEESHPSVNLKKTENILGSTTIHVPDVAPVSTEYINLNVHDSEKLQVPLLLKENRPRVDFQNTENILGTTIINLPDVAPVSAEYNLNVHDSDNLQGPLLLEKSCTSVDFQKNENIFSTTIIHVPDVALVSTEHINLNVRESEKLQGPLLLEDSCPSVDFQNTKNILGTTLIHEPVVAAVKAEYNLNVHDSDNLQGPLLLEDSRPSVDFQNTESILGTTIIHVPDVAPVSTEYINLNVHDSEKLQVPLLLKESLPSVDFQKNENILGTTIIHVSDEALVSTQYNLNVRDSDKLQVPLTEISGINSDIVKSNGVSPDGLAPDDPVKAQNIIRLWPTSGQSISNHQSKTTISSLNQTTDDDLIKKKIGELSFPGEIIETKVQYYYPSNGSIDKQSICPNEPQHYYYSGTNECVKGSQENSMKVNGEKIILDACISKSDVTNDGTESNTLCKETTLNERTASNTLLKETTLISKTHRFNTRQNSKSDLLLPRTKVDTSFQNEDPIITVRNNQNETLPIKILQPTFNRRSKRERKTLSQRRFLRNEAKNLDQNEVSSIIIRNNQNETLPIEVLQPTCGLHPKREKRNNLGLNCPVLDGKLGRRKRSLKMGSLYKIKKLKCNKLFHSNSPCVSESKKSKEILDINFKKDNGKKNSFVHCQPIKLEDPLSNTAILKKKTKKLKNSHHSSIDDTKVSLKALRHEKKTNNRLKFTMKLRARKQENTNEGSTSDSDKCAPKKSLKGFKDMLCNGIPESIDTKNILLTYEPKSGKKGKPMRKYKHSNDKLLSNNKTKNAKKVVNSSAKTRVKIGVRRDKNLKKLNLKSVYVMVRDPLCNFEVQVPVEFYLKSFLKLTVNLGKYKLSLS